MDSCIATSIPEKGSASVECVVPGKPLAYVPLTCRSENRVSNSGDSLEVSTDMLQLGTSYHVFGFLSTALFDTSTFSATTLLPSDVRQTANDHQYSLRPFFI
ncbi:hypothetical protein [Absidia glauca]|uniref:Uncharacterized protein n=1 Tax=Absidia glauca TaxID=4829 RepID=A0A168T7R3_ABSGL|nr:hypothetical protein [Absidia glauca]